MSTIIRAELSEKNKYWIDKHRYYELKHFCLQYPTWVKARNALTSLANRSDFSLIMTKCNVISNPVEKCAESREYFNDRIEMIERVARMAGGNDIGPYILIGVTQGLSYDCLNARNRIPCCKDVYYDIYRKFFWLLSKERG